MSTATTTSWPFTIAIFTKKNTCLVHSTTNRPTNCNVTFQFQQLMTLYCLDIAFPAPISCLKDTYSENKKVNREWGIEMYMSPFNGKNVAVI